MINLLGVLNGGWQCAAAGSPGPWVRPESRRGSRSRARWVQATSSPASSTTVSQARVDGEMREGTRLGRVFAAADTVVLSSCLRSTRREMMIYSWSKGAVIRLPKYKMTS
jgi:hypothetical protein